MNTRVIALIVGIITLGLGLASLAYPVRILGLLGFAVVNASSAAAAYGEVRAMYGGLFVVLGVYVLMGAIDPNRYRPHLMMIGLAWLGVCAGRLIGVSIDGNPGLFGWIYAVFEGLMGSLLLIAALVGPPKAEGLTVGPGTTPPPGPTAF
jgi:hypothetical protein